jgi:hypothetical protein
MKTNQVLFAIFCAGCSGLSVASDGYGVALVAGYIPIVLVGMVLGSVFGIISALTKSEQAQLRIFFVASLVSLVAFFLSVLALVGSEAATLRGLVDIYFSAMFLFYVFFAIASFWIMRWVYPLIAPVDDDEAP